MSSHTHRMASITDAVLEAYRASTPLAILGQGSKRYYGQSATGIPLDVTCLDTILDYAPTELVITVGAGLSPTTLRHTLAESGQMLAFDPPELGDKGGTIGGVIACGLSGPGRPFVGAVRDSVLGVVCVNGRGERLRFGGRVIKNVAGYDVARLMVGAQGSLGVLLEISLKTVPLTNAEHYLCIASTPDEALFTMQGYFVGDQPLTGLCYFNGKIYLRLPEPEDTLCSILKTLNPRSEVATIECTRGAEFWSALRDMRLEFFTKTTMPLWRIQVPFATDHLPLSGKWLLDWGGMQRWLKTSEKSETVIKAAKARGGHAMPFSAIKEENPMLSPSSIYQKLKQAFDPKEILNRTCSPPGLQSRNHSKKLQ